MVDLIVYDIEICREIRGGEDWKRINSNWFGSAVVYNYDRDQYIFFLHERGLQSLRNLINRSRVVSFNGINFDSKIVLGKGRKLQSYKGTRPGVFISDGDIKWLEYDLYVQVLRGHFGLESDLIASHRISPGGLKLDDLARATLGIRKSGSGALAPRLYMQGLYDDLLAYNLQDVRVLKALFEHAQRTGYVISKKRERVKIVRAEEWSV